MGHTGGLEVEPLDIRRAADTDEDLIDGESLFACWCGQKEQLFGTRNLHAVERRRESHDHPVPFHRGLEHLCRIPVFALEKHVGGLDEGDFGAEPGEGLGQLAADGPPADNCQPLRLLGQVEHVVVGQKPGLRETGNWRCRGASAGGNHRF